MANAILESGFEFDSGTLIYNRFKTVVSYETSEIPLHTLDTILNASKIHVYDSLDADVSTTHDWFYSRELYPHFQSVTGSNEKPTDFFRPCAVITSSTWLRPSTTP